jgi:hypothetical protein
MYKLEMKQIQDRVKSDLAMNFMLHPMQHGMDPSLITAEQ